MKGIKIDYGDFYAFPEGIESIEEFVGYLNSHYHSFIRLKEYLTDNCREPYFIESEWAWRYLNVAQIGRVAEAEMHCTFTCTNAEKVENSPTVFTVHPVGQIRIRSRETGDTIRLPGGTKSIKKLFIDRKIPAVRRSAVPILCDDAGILGIPGIGVNLDRAADSLPALRIECEL